MKIIFITGAPGVGKTTFSKELAKKLGIYNVYSTDAIRDIMRACIKRDATSEVLHRPAIQGFDLAPNGIIDIIYGFIGQSNTVKIGIDAVVASAIKNNSDLILEGIHLIPGIVENIKDVEFEHYVLYLESSDEHLQRIQNQGSNRSTYKLENFEKARAFQEYLLNQKVTYDLKVIEVSH